MRWCTLAAAWRWLRALLECLPLHLHGREPSAQRPASWPAQASQPAGSSVVTEAGSPTAGDRSVPPSISELAFSEVAPSVGGAGAAAGAGSGVRVPVRVLLLGLGCGCCCWGCWGG
jgi:hypothetical protein